MRKRKKSATSINNFTYLRFSSARECSAQGPKKKVHDFKLMASSKHICLDHRCQMCCRPMRGRIFTGVPWRDKEHMPLCCLDRGYQVMSVGSNTSESCCRKSNVAAYRSVFTNWSATGKGVRGGGAAVRQHLQVLLCLDLIYGLIGWIRISLETKDHLVRLHRP